MTIIETCKEYLEKNFYEEISVEVCNYDVILPTYILSRYSFYKGIVMDQPLLFLIGKTPINNKSINELKNDSRLIEKHIGLSVVFVFSGGNNYIREQMTKERISFVIPGKQIFTPYLGFIYSDRHSAKYKSGENNLDIDEPEVHLTPAAQMLLFYHITLEKECKKKSEIAKKLNYTIMSVNRAENQLKNYLAYSQNNLCDAFRVQENNIREYLCNRNVLTRLIYKRVIVDKNSIPKNILETAVLSGEAALSKITNLAEPRMKTYAIPKKEWMEIKNMAREVPRGDLSATELEIWNGTVLTKDERIHPLALYFSLREVTDERVISELTDMLSKTEWGGVIYADRVGEV